MILQTTLKTIFDDKFGSDFENSELCTNIILSPPPQDKKNQTFLILFSKV